jgi:hypothetical protein
MGFFTRYEGCLKPLYNAYQAIRTRIFTRYGVPSSQDDSPKLSTDRIHGIFDLQPRRGVGFGNLGGLPVQTEVPAPISTVFVVPTEIGGIQNAQSSLLAVHATAPSS